MTKQWCLFVFGLSFILLSLLKSQDVRSLQTFYRSSPTLKFQNFAQAKKTLNPKDQELLELWESMLTGRSAPLATWMKSRYQQLGLNHLFTPSGFHLSAVLWPLMKFLPSPKHQILVLILIALGLLCVPGQGALKRMVQVKIHQKTFGFKFGFISALLMDVLFGSFQDGALSFSYSFLFLGIVYSGIKGFRLILLFFLGQVLLAFFQDAALSPLILIFSPLLNFAFGISMPLLFLLALPLWNWQLKIGIFILKILQGAVDLSAHGMSYFPTWEIHIYLLFLLGLLIISRKKEFLLALVFLSGSLNLDKTKKPNMGSHMFHPKGEIIKVVTREKDDVIFFSDGKCKRKLVRGYWWEACRIKGAPRKRSTFKKTKKLLRLS